MWSGEKGDKTSTGNLEWDPDLAVEQFLDCCGHGLLCPKHRDSGC